jgi:hypothetical protein
MRIEKTNYLYFYVPNRRKITIITYESGALQLVSELLDKF